MFIQKDKTTVKDKYSCPCDDNPIKLVNQRYSFPFSFLGSDGKTYILDQYADDDGVFRFHVIIKSGPYSYQQVYDDDPFMLKDQATAVPSELNAFLVKHYMGDQNTTTAITGAATSVAKTDKSKAKFQQNLTWSWANLLKAVPKVIGHVVQIGTTVAQMLATEDDPDPIIATHVMSTTPVQKPCAAYTLMTSDVGDDAYGIFLAFFESQAAAALGTNPLYVCPFVNWKKAA